MLRALLLILVLLTACGRPQPPEDVAGRWADAVVQGDYATMRAMSADADLVAIWFGVMDLPFRRGQLKDWHIIDVQPQGHTTMVRFQFTGGPSPLCTRFHINDRGKVSATHAMVECEYQEAVR